MELDHEFTVAAPVDKAWKVLIDLDRVVPCMPGAALTSYDGDAFEGTVKVKIGPVSMTFAGKGRFVEKDEAARRMVVEASGKDSRGGGTAKATVNATLTEAGPGSTGVKVHSDLAVTGRVAQFGRGMIADVSARLLGQFTDCLSGKLAEGAPAESAPAAAAAAAPAAAAPAAPAAASAASAAAAAEPASAGGVTTETAEKPAVPTPPTSATPDSPAPAATAAPATRTPAEVEPVDLLAVTGVSGAAKRSLPYALVFVGGAVVGAILVRWLT
jgi:carbon monoxide dehydrogenase subunit G